MQRILNLCIFLNSYFVVYGYTVKCQLESYIGWDLHFICYCWGWVLEIPVAQVKLLKSCF